ncbi:hypothetical protein BJ138DRAFT_495618 [Hygrophoropsis aurantiaca]|uniref:Uncharacterized protein n=1 Tax=Hygrophoropsis aurantiaca TaxID=72124 RepID=A0ACB8A1S8_9AGAM|nr:hypothetical protein BJ138DRAFT_495618 [Hygrophoropsis aurantiaca]
MTTIEDPSSINYEITNQPILMCTFLAILLFGVASAQTFYYFHKFPNDGYITRIAVGSIWLVEAVHSGLLVNGINHLLIAKAGDLSALLFIYYGLSVAYIFGYVSTYFVNLTISRNPLMCIAAGILATARVAAELAFCIMSIMYSEWQLFADVLLKPFLTALVLSAAVDCVIAISMTYYLRQGRTSFAHTRSIVNRLIRYVVGSGLLTFLFTTAIMLSLLIPRRSLRAGLTFFAMVPVQSKLYTNSLLVSCVQWDSFSHNGTESSYRFDQHRRAASGSDIPMLSAEANG